ncbi:methyl-accepting chemotaxis protein [Caldimonas thermodepolymerans]|uniref:methyl-accepting chemotaxis protein n=1 Tax=Caldimonas thermodepolymerans TaxID=215580 RepID=UPI002236A9DF|nr:methyl-accepting chemotaxis protein [Caldimonas thermodepolymerans]UZG43510.1 methyl-accepting chemotaxis protein [Caldimonas thermodepolymerans]
MLSVLRRKADAPVPAPATQEAGGTRDIDVRSLVQSLQKEAARLGREAAEVRGVLDDTIRFSSRQTEAIASLAQQLQGIQQSQAAIGNFTAQSLQSVDQARSVVEAVSKEVAAIVDTLREVAGAAQQITQIAMQTRLVAFNASVEAKRAGEAGRGFGVVADAVKDLAAKVEGSSKDIMSTVGALDTRIAALSREISHDASGRQQGAFHRAVAAVEADVHRISDAACESRAVTDTMGAQMDVIDREVRQATEALHAAMGRSEAFLKVSEHLMEVIAACGIETEDTPFIRAAQEGAAQLSRLLEEAVRDGTIALEDLFDERYVPVEGTDPQQHLTRFVELTDRLFPPVQERLLGLSERVVFCAAVDRNGYLPTHNRKYSHPQRRGDTAWNTVNSRNRRIFNDRTALASARNRKPFLLQTYRRDMGGGQFVLMKEVAAPIVVQGRHWGGLRFAYAF